MSNLASYLVLISLLASCYWISPTLQHEPAFIPTPETQSLIDKICWQMELYSFCNSVFRKHLPAPSTDAIGLTKITIQQSLNHAAATIQFIRTLRRKETDKVLIQRYQSCFQEYNAIQSHFTDAYFSFINRAYGSIANNERPSYQAELRCEQALTTGPERVNHLKQHNDKMRRLIAMAWVTVDLIGKKA